MFASFGRNTFRISVVRYSMLNTSSVFVPTYRNFIQLSERVTEDRNSLFKTQTRHARLNPLRFKLKEKMKVRSSIDAVVEPTPPRFFGIRSFHDMRRWGLNVYWNVRSWWESLDSRLSLKIMRTIASDYYIKFRQAEANGDINSLNNIANLNLVRELKRKTEKQKSRKDIKVIWNHDTPKAKISTIRFLRYPESKIKILQVGVRIKCNQGVTIKKNNKVIKEVPKKTITELLVMEASLAVAKTDKFQWKLLDILDGEGHGILPRGETQTLLEEQ